ncbi:hypothetical protein AY599_16810 [Leptolyngbya valderiana BDU 20041]|nr:hypothetical protein AY599_16810 [Leptolyngbya valderiana BDU 20041]
MLEDMVVFGKVFAERTVFAVAVLEDAIVSVAKVGGFQIEVFRFVSECCGDGFRLEFGGGLARNGRLVDEILF